ncbi:NAD(P)-dependent alcohol dehydrogenase [Flavisphingomonas formosensis]|uniref:NAD(P)-dependent alcohol dehydrogenase n=1 Tax=Flavisphingomonas formosensis TaxID=861534 RepID=UPI0018DF725E|nr:NAD(P)-dependent alcohol dehydrogenase [Sphingomonas formosensis]
MTMVPAKAYAALQPAAPLEPYRMERRSPGAHDLLMEILYCGICHTDIHQTQGEFPGSIFPMVPGHEVVGRVVATGAEVSTYKVGDVIGVGCFVDSCRECRDCAEGEEQFCDLMVPTYNGLERDGKTPTYGGYSSHMTVDERYALRIPEGLDPAAAAPLLCAGITTYSPLRHWNVGPGSKVGVVGLGGLGHMAVKLAAAMGADVTVFSTSADKREDALRLGARDFVLSRDPDTFQRLAGRFDLIMNTVSASIPYDSYISLLQRDGTLVLLGVSMEPMELSGFPLIARRKKIAGSPIGGIRETQEMLDFCAVHGLGADIEVIPIQQADTAFQRVVKGDVRYRFVIDMASLA